jgi:hypothetical protein
LGWQTLRLVVAHSDRYRALLQGNQRDQKIAELEAQATQWVGKLDAQDGGSDRNGLWSSFSYVLLASSPAGTPSP